MYSPSFFWVGIRLQGSTRTLGNSQSCFILSTNSSACDTGLPASLWTFPNKLLWAAQHPYSRKIDLLLVTEHYQLTLEWTWAFVHYCPMARSTLPPLFLQSRFHSSPDNLYSSQCSKETFTPSSPYSRPLPGTICKITSIWLFCVDVCEQVTISLRVKTWPPFMTSLLSFIPSMVLLQTRNLKKVCLVIFNWQNTCCFLCFINHTYYINSKHSRK